MTYPREVDPAVGRSATVGMRTRIARRPWRERDFWLRYSAFYGVIVVSHNLQHVFSIADLIAVLRHGQMVGSVRPTETSGEAVVRMIVGADEAAVDLPTTPRGGR
jgi:ABC-type proline/glycine betaine transport system ATPase subunit